LVDEWGGCAKPQAAGGAIVFLPLTIPQGLDDRADAVNFGQSLRREPGGEKFFAAAQDSSELL
jgi:hypothetical protein